MGLSFFVETIIKVPIPKNKVINVKKYGDTSHSTTPSLMII